MPETTNYSNTGKWDRWYSGLTVDTPQTYGDTITYEMGVDWLRDCDVVYDWGCGKGGFAWLASQRNATFTVRGIDNSVTPFAAVNRDLAEIGYVLGPPNARVGHFMRHVLEHDYRWPQILDNFLANISYRGVIVLFTPTQAHTHEIAWNEDPGVPDIGFAPIDIETRVLAHGLSTVFGTYRTNTQYGEETVFTISKE